MDVQQATYIMIGMPLVNATRISKVSGLSNVTADSGKDLYIGLYRPMGGNQYECIRQAPVPIWEGVEGNDVKTIIQHTFNHNPSKYPYVTQDLYFQEYY